MNIRGKELFHDKMAKTERFRKSAIIYKHAEIAQLTTKHTCMVQMSRLMHQCSALPLRSPVEPRLENFYRPDFPRGPLELRSLFSSELRHIPNEEK